ncbi:PREDICTED: zinc metalloproteinase nas-4-like [Cyphomyrmex costatus]|uniref:Metalloendopeptidase n=1 Tax=Cyphomyrmex costatus TaxID=456900 RepID=A0A151IHP8_9HYME|nr:PREDICTED: zinc metalloproteinase nas-4-like [Cyphomyrmex costatus]KYN01688.1 Zinc metalloproteinase nas-4 [Cyphomyrmex costatus]
MPCRLLATLVWTLLVLTTLTFAWPSFRRRNGRDIFDNAVNSPGGLIAHLRNFGSSLYRFPSNETGLKVAQWREDMDVNPEELGEYVEGDILFPPNVGRNGLAAVSARWPNGVIPFIISPYFNAQQQKVIYDAMSDYHKYTCIRFKPYTGEESDYVRITAGNTGCWSSVGRIGGRQDINLQVPGCLTQKGTVIHELMHAVGFLHEHSRYERDDYVNILWDNISNGHTHNFNKAPPEITYAFGVGYDYGSVMHYSSTAFSRNYQLKTIVPKRQLNGGILDLIGGIFQENSEVKLGQREGFSKKDILKIRRMYRCGKRTGIVNYDYQY